MLDINYLKGTCFHYKISKH